MSFDLPSLCRSSSRSAISLLAPFALLFSLRSVCLGLTSSRRSFHARTLPIFLRARRPPSRNVDPPFPVLPSFFQALFLNLYLPTVLQVYEELDRVSVLSMTISLLLSKSSHQPLYTRVALRCEEVASLPRILVERIILRVDHGLDQMTNLVSITLIFCRLLSR